MKKINLSSIVCLLIIGYSNCFAQININGKIATNDNDVENNLLPIFTNYPIDREKNGKSDYDWDVKSKTVKMINGSKYVFVISEMVLDSAAIVVYKEVNNEFIFVGGYCYMFGGNGATIEIKRIVSDKNKTIIKIECLGYMKRNIGKDSQIIDLEFENSI